MKPEQLISELQSIANNTVTGKKQPVMGWTCAYIPEEIIMAFGFIPYRVRGSHLPTSKANALIPGNLCSHILSCLETALDKKYDFLSGIIIANTSDAMRRLYDAWREYTATPFIHMLDVPKKITGQSERYFLQIFLHLITAIEKHFGLKFSLAALAEAIATCNETRQLLDQLYELKTRNGSAITNAVFSEITNLSFSVPKKELNLHLQSFINNFSNNLGHSDDSAAKVLVTGSFYDNHELTDIITEAGADIVFEDICTRGRYYLDKVIIDKDHLVSLANRYLLRLPCARMIDTEKRINRLAAIIKEHNVNAVIYHVLKFDDAYLFEFPLLRKRLLELEIPVLFIEGENRLCNTGQLKTRIQAFVEKIVPIRSYL